MSKFCPFCDDVKDSELDSAEALKNHLEEEHGDQIVETGKPERLDKGGEVEQAVPAQFREIKKG